MLREHSIRLGLVVFLMAVVAPAWAQEGTLDVRKLADEIICTCGCAATLNNCQNSMTCNEAVKHKAELREMVEQGMSKAEIFDRMVEKYGETILAAPTKRGFNLTAWVTPFAAVFAGGLLVVVVVRKWTRKEPSQDGAAAVQEGSLAQSEFDPELDDRIERELRDLSD
jgi:cytochrome c-type biogenesis protein CcmH